MKFKSTFYSITVAGTLIVNNMAYAGIGGPTTLLGRDNTYTDNLAYHGHVIVGVENNVSDSNHVGHGVFGFGNTLDDLAGSSLIVGDHNISSGTDTTVIGGGNKVYGNRNYAMGEHVSIGSSASPVNSSIGMGYYTEVNSSNAIAIGNKAVIGSGLDNAVVIGTQSLSEGSHNIETVSEATVGSYTFSNFTGTAHTDGSLFSIGARGKERQLINVAAGHIDSSSTDAINGSQLYSVADKLGRAIDSKADKTTVEALETKVDTNKAETDTVISNLDSKVDTNKAETDDAIADLDTRKADKTTVDALETKVDTNKAETDTAISNLDSKVDTNKAETDNAIADLDTRKADKTTVDALETKVDTNKAETDTAISNLDSKVDTNKAETDDAIADLDTRKADKTTVDALETKVDTNKAETDTAISNLDSKVDTNKAETDNAIADLDTRKADKTTVDALETKVDTNKAETDTAISNLDSKVDTNKAETDDAIADLDTRKADKTTVDALETKVDNNKTETDTAIDTIRDQVSQNTRDIADLVNNGGSARINNLENKVDNLERKVEKENRKLRGGIAAATAIASIPQAVTAGQGALGVGVGSHNGQNALAVGYSRVSDNNKLIFKVNAAVSQKGGYNVGAGMAYQW
ncbi:MAG: YadA-like family protein [Lonepinella koalarum]|nr:YadA-like family protein [Lonepinella koalarum]